MDSSDLVVSSIRAGMKREFAMLMKAQLEMGAFPASPRRMTRSQSSSSFSRGDTEINVKSARVSTRRMKKDKDNAVETKKKDMEKTYVAGEEGGLRRVTRSQSSRIFSRGDTEINVSVRVSTKRMKRDKKKNAVETEEKDMEKADVAGKEEGAGLITVEAVSSNEDISCSLEPELVGIQRNEPETVSLDLVQPLHSESPLAIEVDTNPGEDTESFRANLEYVEQLEVEKMGGGSDDGVLQPSCTEVATPHAMASNGDLIHDFQSSIAESLITGALSNGDCMLRLSLSVKPVRRFTRSCLKLQDEDMESGKSTGMIEPGANSTTSSSPSEIVMEISNDVKMTRMPKRIKDLLKTGLLEGLHVRYIYGLKVNKQARFELKGIIKGTGILCSCDDCNGRKVVTPNKFELHARSGNKRPPEYIYLENGKSLSDVLNACKANSSYSDSHSLAQVILDAIGLSNYTTAFCITCKGIIPEECPGKVMLLCNSCFTVKEPGAHNVNICDYAHRSPLAVSSASVSSVSQREVLEVEQISSNNHQLKRLGRLTRKDLRMHKFVFSEDILPDGTALSYFMHGKKRLEGVKKDGGILCMCCNEVVSPSQFEAHAGFPTRRKPYMSIYTSNGVSLHQLSLELSKNRKYSPDENDDLCSICEDGGDLLCCENCPRSFHSECVGISSIPHGTWYCKYCQNMFEQERFAEHDANAIAAGRVPGVDPLAEISQRCIRIISAFAADIGGCAICREHDFSSPEFTDRTVIICDQCEREYHVGCLRENEVDDLKALPDGEWFCCKKCSSINSALQKMVSDGEQKLADDLLSNMMKKKSEEEAPENDPTLVPLDVKWRILGGKDSSEDTRVWLSGAVSIFHDRFDPIADASTGRLDLIPHMVYGRHFKDQDFCGMHCAILTVNSIVVSAGLFRVFGEDAAELPLVATRSDSQGKGYFQSLYYCIENFLKSQNVKDLVLPAADEAASLWKNRFGFQIISQEQLEVYKRSYQMMIFEGTAVLRKKLVEL